MPNTTTMNGKSTETKSRIFFTAAKLFTEKGYSRVSIREICEAVGVQKPTLYYYFKDKETLFVELVDEANRLGEELAVEFLDEQQSWVENLHGFMKVHIAFLERYPDLVSFFSLAMFMSLPENLEKKVCPDVDTGLEYLEKLLQDAQRNGQIHKHLNINMLALTLLGTIRYLIMHQAKKMDARFDLRQTFEDLFLFWKETVLAKK